MKSVVFLFFLVVSSAVWGQDLFDRFGDALAQSSLDDSMHPWERELSKREWQTILENCYDRNENSDAKDALISLLINHNQISDDVSVRQNQREILLYCAHALALANRVGINLKVIPLRPSDRMTLIRAKTIEDCYSVTENGFSQWLRRSIRVVARTQAGVSGEGAKEDITLSEIILAYTGLCGSTFAKDNNIPVQVVFSR